MLARDVAWTLVSLGARYDVVDTHQRFIPFVDKSEGGRSRHQCGDGGGAVIFEIKGELGTIDFVMVYPTGDSHGDLGAVP